MKIAPFNVKIKSWLELGKHNHGPHLAYASHNEGSDHIGIHVFLLFFFFGYKGPYDGAICPITITGIKFWFMCILVPKFNIMFSPSLQYYILNPTSKFDTLILDFRCRSTSIILMKFETFYHFLVQYWIFSWNNQ